MEEHETKPFHGARGALWSTEFWANTGGPMPWTGLSPVSASPCTESPAESLEAPWGSQDTTTPSLPQLLAAAAFPGSGLHHAPPGERTPGGGRLDWI